MPGQRGFKAGKPNNSGRFVPNWLLSVVTERLRDVPVSTYRGSLDEEDSHSRRDMARSDISRELHSMALKRKIPFLTE